MTLFKKCQRFMIKNSIYKYIIALGLIGGIQCMKPIMGIAQSDFGYDLSVSGETKIAKRLKLDLEAGMRTQDNAKKIDRYIIGTGLSYRFFQTQNKQISLKANVGFDYMWINKLAKTSDEYISFIDSDEPIFWGSNTSNQYWRKRFRINPGLSFSYEPNKRWSFGLKETFQYNHYCNASKEIAAYRPFGLNDDDEVFEKNPEYEGYYAEPINEVYTKELKAKDRLVLRSTVSASYNIKHFPVDIFASAEYGCGLNYSKNKWKFTGGYDYKINKNNKISVFYRYNKENDEYDTDGHIVGLGYKIDF